MFEDGCEVVGSDGAGEAQPLAGVADPDTGGFTSRRVVLLSAVGDHGGVVVAGPGGELAETQQGDGRTGRQA